MISNSATSPAAIPVERSEALGRVLEAIGEAKKIALTTHVNADGDGSGCEAALAAWLSRAGKRIVITNPTPFPPLYRHLIEDQEQIVEPGTARTHAAWQDADLLLVLDTSEKSRIGRIAPALENRTVAVIDHHLPSEEPITGLVAQDERACATGELVFDLLNLAGLERPWPALVARGVYTAILTDTGSFRYSNTTARAHWIAADLITQGVDPEAVYRAVYASVPLRRLRLMERALARLEVDPHFPITWITLDRAAMEETGTASDDLDGIVEQARSVEGTEVAILFRETADGSTKISFRSSGKANVNRVARLFGGGGHRKASGALVGGRLDEIVPKVLDEMRRALQQDGLAG
ncbi:MAG: DHH family phosphoesterase [Longimicrobiales bacterium]